MGLPSTADLNPFFIEMEYVTEQINTERLTYLSVFYLFSFFITPQNGIYMSYLLLFNKPCPPNSGLKQQLFAYYSEGQQFGLVSAEWFFCWSHLRHPRGCCLRVAWLSCRLTLVLLLWLGFPLQGHNFKEASLVSSCHDLRFQEGNSGSCKVFCDPSLEMP